MKILLKRSSDSSILALSTEEQGRGQLLLILLLCSTLLTLGLALMSVRSGEVRGTDRWRGMCTAATSFLQSALHARRTSSTQMAHSRKMRHRRYEPQNFISAVWEYKSSGTGGVSPAQRVCRGGAGRMSSSKHPSEVDCLLGTAGRATDDHQRTSTALTTNAIFAGI